MNEKELIKYYNKFNEDKRLTRKHAKIEFNTALHYIEKLVSKGSLIADIGAGKGAYSTKLEDLGYKVEAVELVLHNLREIEKKGIKCHLGNATNLSMLENNMYDAVLLFGPMYHLIDEESKIKALNEAKRIVKDNGLIFISYCMNEYAVITHGFIESNIKDDIKNNLLDEEYHITPKETDLYSFVRLEDINKYKDICNLKRVTILSQDGPSEYLKRVINNMDDETFNLYFKYHLKTCERPELLGAGRHILDILKK